MAIARLATHLLYPAGLQMRGAFPPPVRGAIQSAIRDAEATHTGQIRLAVEAVLHPRRIWRDQSVEDRALEVFSELRIWDTEENNGVLIYLLLADRRVAIVADRGIHAKAGANAWGPIARAMEACFQRRAFEQGALLGIQLISEQLTRYFPAKGAGPNELPDEVVIL